MIIGDPDGFWTPAGGPLDAKIAGILLCAVGVIISAALAATATQEGGDR
jgi:hypothetical protein